MPKDIVTIPAIAVDRLRRKAKRLKKETEITHQQALDSVARQSNYFQSWHHLIQAAKLSTLAEQAFRHGLVFGMDFKDLQDYPNDNPEFIQDERMSVFVCQDYKKSVENWTEDNDDDLEEFEHCGYFRYIGNVPSTYADALVLITNAFFFPPRLVWINGVRCDPLAERDDVFDFDDENLIAEDE